MRSASPLLAAALTLLVANALVRCSPPEDALFSCEGDGGCAQGRVCIRDHCHPVPDGGAPVALAFAVAPAEVTAGACSAPLRVELRDDAGAPARSISAFPVELGVAPDAGFAFFQDPACSTPSPSLSIPPLETGVELHVRGTQAGFKVLTASSTGLRSALRQLTVVSGAPASADFSSPPAELLARECSGPVVLELRDAFGNVTPSTAAQVAALGTDLDGGLLFYGDAACTAPISGLGIPAGVTTASFHFRGITGGERQLVAVVGALPAATQTETILPTVRAGSCDIGDGGPTLVSCAIVPPHDDPAHTFLIFQATSTSANPGTGGVRCLLSPLADRVDCARSVDGEPVAVRWQSVELPAGLNVQTVTVPCTGVSTLAPINPVAAPRSFLLSGGQLGTGSNFAADDLNTSRLLGPTDVQFATDGVTGCGVSQPMSAQVVEWEGITVSRGFESGVSGEFMPDGGISAAVGPLPPAPLSRTVVLSSFSGRGYPSPRISDRAVRATVASPTQLDFERCLGELAPCSGTAVVNLAWERIDFGAAATVQHRGVTLGTGQLDATVTIEPVDPTRSVVFATGQTLSGQALGESAYDGDDVVGESAATFRLVDVTTVAVHRASALAPARWSFQVVQIEP